MIFLKRFVNNENPKTFVAKLRQRRFLLFLDLIKTFPSNRSLKILDVGGTEKFWEVMKFADTKHQVTLYNLNLVPINHPNFKSLAGDARHMSEFKDEAFDIVFSNSVIEHVGSYSDQQAMADEIRRVGHKYFIQTPNFSFPIEPHFLFPFFHYLPTSIRIWLISKFPLGWYRERIADRETARQLIDSIRLLKKNELASLFPDASLFHEKIFGLTKSFIAIKK